MVRLRGLASCIALVGACSGPRGPSSSSVPVSASPSVSASVSVSVSALASASASASTVASSNAPPASPDAWAGPLSWTRTPISCAPVVAKPAPSPAKGWTARTLVGLGAFSSIAVSASSADDVWFVAEQGVLAHTPDHGKTFERCDLAIEDRVQSISVASPDDVWLLGDARVMRVEKRATLGVLSQTLESHCGLPFASVLALSNGEAWIASGVLRRSNDGGQSWSRRPTGAGWSPTGDECIDELHGDAHELWTDVGFGVLHSLDDGATWSAVAYDPHTETALHLGVAPDGEVWVAAQDGDVAHSNDDGATWIEESLAPPSPERRLWGVSPVGGGWAWLHADGLWVRRGKAPWVRETGLKNAGGFVGTSKDDVWAFGAPGVVLHRP